MEEKEFEPSRKKLLKERRKGRVVYSAELAQALLLFAALLLFRLFTPLLYRRLAALFRFEHLNLTEPVQAFFQACTLCAWPLALFLLLVAFIAYGLHVAQTGFLFAPPSKGRGRKRFVFPILKGVVFAVILAFFLIATPPSFPVTVGQAMQMLFSRLFSLALALTLGWIALGIFDYFYQRKLFFNEMRMSREEKRDEQREDCTKR